MLHDGRATHFDTTTTNIANYCQLWYVVVKHQFATVLKQARHKCLFRYRDGTRSQSLLEVDQYLARLSQRSQFRPVGCLSNRSVSCPSAWLTISCNFMFQKYPMAGLAVEHRHQQEIRPQIYMDWLVAVRYLQSLATDKNLDQSHHRHRSSPLPGVPH